MENKSFLKKGDIVKIYQDPVTKTDYEGEAELIELYRENVGDGLEIWVVHFLNDYPNETYIRTIYIRQQQTRLDLFNEALVGQKYDVAWYILEKMRDDDNPYYSSCLEKFHDSLEKKGF
jgi:hypothetical protein